MGLEKILWFRKIVLYDKFINKTRRTKSQENSAHHFEENYLTNHSPNVCKVGLNHKDLEVLE